MCDDHSEADNARMAADGVTRRAFGAGAGAAGLALLLPSPADAATVSGRRVQIKTPDGMADAYFVAPTSGRHPGVLVWPDIMGLRPAFEQMGRRLAESGYAVLIVNQFYRSTKAPFLKSGETFGQPAVRARITPWRDLLTAEAVTRDGVAFTRFLDAQKEVDPQRGLASSGYCMGGPMTIQTAAARADRYRAVASFHGAGLVSDKPGSPHLLIPKLKADALIAIAENDDRRSPKDKDVLRAAFAAAKRPAEIEVYAGAMHGWCPPDSQAYDRVQAERAWGRMLALFGRTLARPA